MGGEDIGCMKRLCLVKDKRTRETCQYLDSDKKRCGILSDEYFKRKSDLFSPIPRTLCQDLKERKLVEKDIYDVFDEGIQKDAEGEI
jgi:hypothetical protein